MPPTARAQSHLVVIVATSIVAGGSEAWAGGELAVVQDTLERGGALAWEAGQRFLEWVETGYARRPAMMIGLAGLLLLPPLLMLGLLLYRAKSPRRAPPAFDLAFPATGPAPRIELEGCRPIALPPGRDLVQIGRHEDNDICIPDDSVERYHAVIVRHGDQGYLITDVSGQEPEGLRINGAPCASAVLADGDMLEIGRARMRFASAA